MKLIIDNKKVQRTYIEAKFWNSEGTLLYETFRIEVNKVPSEYKILLLGSQNRHIKILLILLFYQPYHKVIKINNICQEIYYSLIWNILIDWTYKIYVTFTAYVWLGY